MPLVVSEVERSCATPSGQDRPDRFGLDQRSRPGSASRGSNKASLSSVATRPRGRTSRGCDPARHQRAVGAYAIRARGRCGRLARRPAVGIDLDDDGDRLRDPNGPGAPSAVASTSAPRSRLKAGLNEDLDQRVLALNVGAAEAAGAVVARRQRAGKPVEIREAQIAGIAVAQVTVATRNARHLAILVCFS